MGGEEEGLGGTHLGEGCAWSCCWAEAWRCSLRHISEGCRPPPPPHRLPAAVDGAHLHPARVGARRGGRSPRAGGPRGCARKGAAPLCPPDAGPVLFGDLLRGWVCHISDDKSQPGKLLSKIAFPGAQNEVEPINSKHSSVRAEAAWPWKPGRLRALTPC